MACPTRTVYFLLETDKGGNHGLPHGFRHIGRQACRRCLFAPCLQHLRHPFGRGHSLRVMLGFQTACLCDQLLPLRQQADELAVQRINLLPHFGYGIGQNIGIHFFR